MRPVNAAGLLLTAGVVTLCLNLYSSNRIRAQQLQTLAVFSPYFESQLLVGANNVVMRAIQDLGVAKPGSLQITRSVPGDHCKNSTQFCMTIGAGEYPIAAIEFEAMEPGYSQRFPLLFGIVLLTLGLLSWVHQMIRSGERTRTLERIQRSLERVISNQPFEETTGDFEAAELKTTLTLLQADLERLHRLENADTAATQLRDARMTLMQLAHDTKPVLGSLKLLLQNKTIQDEKIRNLLNLCHERMEELMSSMIHLEEGQVWTHLDTLSREIIASFNDRAPQLSLTTSVATPLLLSKQTFQGLKDILTGMISNSIEAQGGLIELKLSADLNTLSAELTDHGPGFDERILSSVRSGLSPGTTKLNGNGLTLSRAMRWTASHGGRLTLDNLKPVGARVRIMVPLKGEFAHIPASPQPQ